MKSDLRFICSQKSRQRQQFYGSPCPPLALGQRRTYALPSAVGTVHPAFPHGSDFLDNFFSSPGLVWVDLQTVERRVKRRNRFNEERAGALPIGHAGIARRKFALHLSRADATPSGSRVRLTTDEPTETGSGTTLQQPFLQLKGDEDRLRRLVGQPFSHSRSVFCTC